MGEPGRAPGGVERGGLTESRSPAAGTAPFAPWVGLLVTGGIFAVWLLASGMGLALVATRAPQAGAGPRLAAAISGGSLLALLVLAAVLALSGRRPVAALAFHPFHPRSGAVFLAVTAVTTALAEALRWATGQPLVPPFVVELYGTSTAHPWWLAVLAVFVVVPALFEEVLFRGVLLPSLARTPFLRPAGAVVATSLLWALVHSQYGAIDQAAVFLLGLALGAARLQSGSTLLPVLLHGALNLVAFAQAAWVLG